MEEQIVMLILDTGEHIIGTFIGTNDDGDSIIDKPVSIVPNPDGTGNLLFIPYLQMVEEIQCPFKQVDIRHTLTPKSALLENYRKQFGIGAGIVVPEKQDIILR